CGQPVACTPDGYEPNNSQAAATDWFSVAPQANGSICQNDSDYFAFDVALDPQFTGKLKSLLTIDPSDIGVGSLTVELLDSNGAAVATATSQPTDSTLALDYAIGNINQ